MFSYFLLIKTYFFFFFFFSSWFVDAGVELVSRKSPGVNSKVSARLDANFLSFTAKPKKHEVFPC